MCVCVRASISRPLSCYFQHLRDEPPKAADKQCPGSASAAAASPGSRSQRNYKETQISGEPAGELRGPWGVACISYSLSFFSSLSLSL